MVAFEWKADYRASIKTFQGINNDWDLIDIPITPQTPPPPPLPIPIELIIKPDDVIIEKRKKIPIDINATEATVIPEVKLFAPALFEKVDVINEFVDVQAMFEGGVDAWYAFLNRNLKYPSQAKRMGIDGMVTVRFVVNIDGTIQDIELMRIIGGGCDEIAREVIQNSPNWNPGRIGGRAVRSRMTMPIRFRLN